MTIKSKYTVTAVWVEEQAGFGAWVATSNDVPGLVVEEPTQKKLEKTLLKIVPELLSLHGVITPNKGIDILLSYSQQTLLKSVA